MFSLEKRGFRGDSGDSQDDSPRGKAAHKTTQHLQAWTCMDRQESQSNWPEMQKTLGKPGFFSGEDRNRTFRCYPNVFFGGSNGSFSLRIMPKLSSKFEEFLDLDGFDAVNGRDGFKTES
jgi:hypothetical protein